MKVVSNALQNLIMQHMNGSLTTWYIAELYVFWLNSGRTLLYTGHDTTLNVGGNVYQHWPIDHGDITEVRGTEVSTTDLSIYYNPFDKIDALGVTWYTALKSGAFDNCYLSIDRLFSPIPWQYIMPNISSDYVLKGRFLGRIDVDESRLTSCKLTVKSPMELLNVNIPRNLIITNCINTFGDSMCTIDIEALAVTCAAQSGSSQSSIISGLSQADGYFTQGKVIGLTGKNSGVTRTIKTYSGGTINLSSPFLFTVSAGDTFKVYPGCAKTIAACAAYNNLTHIRDFPFLPVPDTLL
ncbi:hypothetical protein Ga0466249_002299 [Sporomusaceae bacterium BoRhaA]|uniref:DUF2163 domain-containing protein n=1 Tax=Pelorhabdus rhamnosifermentans TaxID=2772457 RepID=UPI001C062930|nr:DUF2163 domain-containing protein [Pelorhabdus rhamnosifermentans]MBU2701185.1 hypothetical protein [Pelorhabdus rhamnosifermentans]